MPRLKAPLIFFAVYVLLTVVSFATSETYFAAWLPLLRFECAWLLPDGFAVEALDLARRNGERLIALHAVTTTSLTFEDGSLPAGEGIKCTTLQAYALYHPVLVYSVLAAWPVETWRKRAQLLLCGILCVLVT